MNESPSPNDLPEIVYPVRGDKLIDYLSSESARKAEQVLQQRAERQTKILSILVSLFAFLGLGGVFGIVKYAAEAEARKAIETQLPTVVDSRARTLIDTEIKNIRTQLNDELLLSDFKVSVETLNGEATDKGSFSDSTRDEVMGAFRGIARKPELTSRATFRTAMRKVIDHFCGANQGAQLDEIHELVGKIALADRSSVLNMAMHYGRIVVGSPYPLDNLNRQKETLEKYLVACESHKSPEVALFWHIILEFGAHQCQRTTVIDNLVLRSRDLRPKDKQVFYTLLRETSDAKRMADKPTQELFVLERVVKEFIRHYKNDLDSELAEFAQEKPVDSLPATKN